MHKAKHPFKNFLITIDEHIREFGNDSAKLYERARCPICNKRLCIRASSAPDSSGHFAHMPGSGYCPTRNSSGSPYLAKHPRKPDIEAGRIMKAAFAANWQSHFSNLNQLVKGLHCDEFKNVVRLADQEHIWNYAALAEYQLPYIFATLMDYPSTNSLKINGVCIRKCWFRCWFDSTITRYDDLWINRTGPLTLIRAWYKQPQRGRPKVDDLIDFYSINVIPDALESTKPPSQFVINTIDPWIKNRYTNL